MVAGCVSKLCMVVLFIHLQATRRPGFRLQPRLSTSVTRLLYSYKLVYIKDTDLLD